MSRSSPLLRLSAFTTLAVGLLVSTPALACWDGTRVSLERVEFSMRPELSWDPKVGDAYASMAMRLRDLIPAGTHLGIYSTLVEVYDCAPGTTDCQPTTSFEWSGDTKKLDALFDTVAKQLNVPAAHASGVRKRPAKRPFTIQASASPDLAAAKAHAAHINASDSRPNEGCYEVGGFPANNDVAHVVATTDESGNTFYRVLVGAYESVESARAEAKKLKGKSFVRELARSGETPR